jgi:hypothetical protein
MHTLTRKIGNILIVEGEPDTECELCHEIAETRPYGPDGKRICWKCAQSMMSLVDENFKRFREGRPPVDKV